MKQGHQPKGTGQPIGKPPSSGSAVTLPSEWSPNPDGSAVVRPQSAPDELVSSPAEDTLLVLQKELKREAANLPTNTPGLFRLRERLLELAAMAAPDGRVDLSESEMDPSNRDYEEELGRHSLAVRKQRAGGTIERLRAALRQEREDRQNATCDCCGKEHAVDWFTICGTCYNLPNERAENAEKSVDP